MLQRNLRDWSGGNNAFLVDATNTIVRMEIDSMPGLDVIRTERLQLRGATWEDLDDIHRVMSSPAAMQYWSRSPHENIDVTRAWFPDALLRHEDPDMDERVIEFNGRVVGYMGIWKMPEFGFILHPDAWGIGVATEAARALIPHLFTVHCTDVITADVDPRNAASLRLLDRLGFVETGRAQRTFFVDSNWCDSVYLELKRPVFEGSGG